MLSGRSAISDRKNPLFFKLKGIPASVIMEPLIGKSGPR